MLFFSGKPSLRPLLSHHVIPLMGATRTARNTPDAARLKLHGADRGVCLSAGRARVDGDSGCGADCPRQPEARPPATCRGHSCSLNPSIAPLKLHRRHHPAATHCPQPPRVPGGRCRRYGAGIRGRGPAPLQQPATCKMAPLGGKGGWGPRAPYIATAGLPEPRLHTKIMPTNPSCTHVCT